MSALLRRFGNQEEKTESNKLGPNNHKPIIIGNKGLKHDYICLLQNFVELVPHAKKGTTLPSSEIRYLDEIAADRHCDTIAFFETSHRGDFRECNFWISSVPEGPSMCFYLDDIATIERLSTIGNFTKKSRHLMFFDAALDESVHLSMAKNLLKRFFTIPVECKHAKHIIDRALSFFAEDGNILMKHYQIQWLEDGTETLVEVGPSVRFIPKFILAGTFKGSKIWVNSTFVSPYQIEKQARRKRALEKMKKRDKQATREEKKQNIPEIEDPMKGLFNETKHQDDANDEEEDELYIEEEEEEANEEE